MVAGRLAVDTRAAAALGARLSGVGGRGGLVEAGASEVAALGLMPELQGELGGVEGFRLVPGRVDEFVSRLGHVVRAVASAFEAQDADAARAAEGLARAGGRGLVPR